MSTYYLKPTAKQNKKPHHHLAGLIYNEQLGILGISHKPAWIAIIFTVGNVLHME
jgi:hypothetical protein